MFFLALLSLPTFSYFILQQPRVQQFLVQKISAKLSAYLGSSVTITNADIDLFNNISFKNLCVHGPDNDTILFTPEFSFHLNAFALSSRYVDIMNVTMNKPQIHFHIDSTGCINFQYIINKFKSNSTDKLSKPLVITIRDINIKEADFTLKSYNHSFKNYGINFSDIHLNPLNLKVTGLSVNSGEIDMNIRNINGTEKSGFILRDFASQLKIYKYFMVFNHLWIKTDNSNIKASKVNFKFNDFKEFNTGIFGKKVKMDIDIKPSEFSTDDLGYFASVFKDYKLKAKVSGKVKGVLNDLKGKDIELLYRNGTIIKGNINVSGLPDFGSAFIYADIKSLITTPDDIQHITIPGNKQGHINLPDNFRSIDYITYNGKFTGLFNDFVANGVIKSNLGIIESDFSFKPDTTGYFKFNGRLFTTSFNLGAFIYKEQYLGNISLNVIVNGEIYKSKKLEGQLNGIIGNIFFNGYNYQNIKINGTVSNKNYNGSAEIEDPNMEADFKGRINLSDQIPVYSFKADIKKANLYKLKIDNRDTGAFMSIFTTADFEGKTFDDIKGELKISNLTFRKTNKEFHINDFLLFSKNINDTNSIVICSDIADVEVRGIYHYKELVNSCKMFVKNYLPSIITDSIVAVSEVNTFKFSIDLKNTRQLTDYFMPGLYISKDTKITGNYNSLSNELNFLATIPLLQHKTKKWYNAYISGKSIGKVYSFISGCNSLNIDKSNALENLTITTDVKNDSIQSRFKWNNWDSIVNKGNISLLTTVNRSGKDKWPLVNILLKPSEIILNDSLWSIHSGLIRVDSSDIGIDNFMAVHQNQYIKAYGNISRNKDKTLMLEFEDVNISNFTNLINAKKWNPEGILNGKAEFANLYGNLRFHAGLRVDSLSINDQKFGMANIKTVFDNSDKNINLEASAIRGGNIIVSAKGLYSIESGKIDFDINTHNLQINLFDPFVSTVFSDIHGAASGNVTLSGTIKSPVLNGSLRMDQVSFIVNYLKTGYHFDGDVKVDRNKFILKNIEVFDKYNKSSNDEHIAFVNGKIDVGQFKEVFIDLSIDARNLECLNTSEKDNNIFYGTGFGTGKLSIKGPTHNIDITSKNIVTDKETKIYLPFQTKSDLAESNFIQKVSNRKPEKPFEKYEIDTESADNKVSFNSGGVKLDITFNVNTNAQLQLIFDEKIGDLIEGTGIGNLNMKYENGNFSMYGNYTIEKGNYLYTLGNVFNKHFILNQGGTITWDGNPLDAIINMEAYYQIYASLQDLSTITTQTGTQTGKIKVNCIVKLTDKLMQPNIKLDITLPNADQSTQDLVMSAISTDEEKYKQFAFLMLAGTFLPSSDMPSQGTGTTAAYATSMELLSNQLSNWFSQMGNTFNINVNYRPADINAKQDLQAGFTTQINSKVSFTGNVDIGGDPTTQPLTPTATTYTNTPIPDAELDYKLTNNGKLQFKTFTRPNQSIDAVSPSTQGVGIVYKEDFNSFFDLIKHYYSSIFKRKGKVSPVKEEAESDDSNDNN